jgi:tetratricopeptide (TPR) repeat protein
MIVSARLAVVFLAASCLTAAGCAAHKAAKKQHVDLEEIHILSGADPELGIDAYDPKILMEKGAEAFNRGAYQLASRFFARFVRDYPSNPRLPSALYNLGLSLENAGDLEGARANYTRVVGEFSSGPEAMDSRFRLGAVLAELGRHRESLEVFEALAAERGLSDTDRLEARVGAGMAMFNMGGLDDAEMALIKAMGAYRSISQREFIENNFSMAEAQYYLGEINRARMEEIRLEFPQEKLEKDLEKKAGHLLEAQNQYIRAIRIGNLQWAAASGYRVGVMYETFHLHMVEAPVPPELDEQQASVYREELRKKVSVLLSKAINVYERTLDMAQRVGLSSKWVDESAERLEKLRQIYVRENLE